MSAFADVEREAKAQFKKERKENKLSSANEICKFYDIIYDAFIVIFSQLTILRLNEFMVNAPWIIHCTLLNSLLRFILTTRYKRRGYVCKYKNLTSRLYTRPVRSSESLT
jgi:hypothetical protein